MSSGTFGGVLWGGGGSTNPVTVGAPVSTLIMPAYRIAGISQRAMTVPSQDMFDEALPELNRMTGSWNCERPKIFTISISPLFPLDSGTKIFNVGSGAVPTVVNGVQYGAFDMPRPQAIQNGVIAITTANPIVRLDPMYQMNDQEWAMIALQDIPNAIPQAFYYDGSYDPTTGWGLIYLYPQTTGGYSVEWYTWQAVPTFSSKDDSVALPPGYEEAIVFNLAKRLAALNPNMQNMQPRSYEIAQQSLAAIEHKNLPQPIMKSDFPGTGSRGAGHFNWLSGEVNR